MIWILTTSFLVWTFLHYTHQTSKVADSSFPVVKPPAKVTIIISAYNEEAFIERTLLSLKAQNVVIQYPELFEFLVVDNKSTDNTALIASQHAKVISSPRGKLNAKEAGTQYATGEILVFVDADAICRPNFLNLLLRHFQRPEVVAVTGVAVLASNNLIDQVITIWLNNFVPILGWVGGGVSAVKKSAYQTVGGYNLNINQFNRKEMWIEEEWLFPRRLRQIGKVVADTEASIIVEPRWQMCRHFPDENCDNPYCQYCKEIAKSQRF